MASSLIRGKYVISPTGSGGVATRHDAAVYQEHGIIKDVGPYRELRGRHQFDGELGGPNFAIIPGLVNSHHHGRGVTTLQMGTCDDCLEMWILAGWGRRPYDHYLMTLYTALNMLESGTTAVMYNHPQTAAATLKADVDAVLRGFLDAGMRVAFSSYLRNQNRVVYAGDEEFLAVLPADLADDVRRYLSITEMSDDEYFAFCGEMHREYHNHASGKARVLLSPANVQWNSDEFLLRCKEEAARHQTGIHMHLVESLYQKDYGIRTWGKTPVEHLQDLEFLGPEVSFAHAVWLTEGDIELLADTGATVCHNASSNLRLKNGIAPVNPMLAAGVNVAMGTDSTAINDDDDLLQEMRLVSKLHRQPGLEASAITVDNVLAMATANAAAPTGFAGEIGALEPGRRADMVLIRLDVLEDPYLDPDLPAAEFVLGRARSQDVAAVIVDGQVVLQDGVHTRASKADVAKELREQLARPLEPETLATRRMAGRLSPYVERFYRSWPPAMGAPHYVYNSRT
ncbi:MAG: amidohydrolase family protein [Chloroflexi bacterium]|nr:amidohydrolase family protein [Chloroflexota bacterium]MYD48229.1 amidohydrolase family protein [Chloroflexota bacterium]